MTSTQSKLGNIKAVLFDMDGLLLDSEIVYTVVVNEILKPYGKEQTWEIKSRLMGKPEREAVITLLSSLWPPTDSNSLFSPDCPFTIESFLSQRNLNLDEAFGKVDAMPGAERLVQHLYKHNVPICVATGSKLRNFKIKSKPHDGIFKPFGQRIICGDDERINRGKPFPDIFLLAAREGLGLEELKDQVREMGEEFDGTLKGGEGDILVFEDGLPGVEAGIKAGMKVVWVPDENLLKLHPTSEAHQTLKSLNDFKPELWGLPPFDN